MTCLDVMPGFVGVASADLTQEVPLEEANRLAAAYRSLCGVESQTSYAAGTFAHVVEFGGETVARSAGRDGSSWWVSAGVLRGARTESLPDAARLDGQFALVTFDAATATLSVATDAFGMFPLFHAASGGRHYFSTSALALAKALSARADVLGLFGYLRTGSHFGTRTLWQGIERLDPAQRLLFSPTGLQLERYWRPEPDDAVTRLDLQAAATHCTEACVETFRSQLGGDGRAWADLTGGYDSRLLTVALARAGVSFKTNTVGPDWSEDVRLAREVARAADFSWTQLEAPEEFAEHRFMRALVAGHAHLDALELSRILATHEAKRRRFPRLLTGGGGEHFQYYAWQTEFTRAGKSNRVNLDNWVRMRLLGSIDTSAFAAYPASDIERDLHERCVAFITPYSTEINTRQLDLLYSYKMMGHFGAFTGAASAVIASELPFYARHVFLAAFSTHHRHRNGHRLMQRMIEGLEPRAAAVRTTKGGPAQPLRLGNAHRFLPYYARLGSKAVEKTTGVRVYRPRAERRATATGGERAAALRFVLGDDPNEAKSLRSRALFKAHELERLLRDAPRPDFTHAVLFGRLLTVEAALRAVGAEVARTEG